MANGRHPEGTIETAEDNLPVRSLLLAEPALRDLVALFESRMADTLAGASSAERLPHEVFKISAGLSLLTAPVRENGPAVRLAALGGAMELAATYSRNLSATSSVFVYAGLPGEPALGPPAFMHRTSGVDNPEAPITHHWLDSTHITFGVITAGLIVDKWKMEASAFRPTSCATRSAGSAPTRCRRAAAPLSRTDPKPPRAAGR